MKKNILASFKFAYFMLCFWVIMTCKAQAYVDATSVTFVIQAVVGLFVAIGAVITVQRHKIVAAYRKWYYGRMAEKQKKDAERDNKSSEGEK